MHPTTARLVVVAVLSVATVPLSPVAPATAHTVLAGSVPAAGATIEPGTAEVVLSFSAPVREGLSTVLVTGADGADHARGAAQVRGDDVAQPVAAPLPPGAGTVSYRVVAADGHPITGTLPFVVAAELANPVPAAPTDPAPTDPAPTDSAPTDPAPTDPAPTDPAPTDLAPTEPVQVAEPAEGGRAALTAGVVGAGVVGAGLIGLLLRTRRRRG